MSKDVWRKLQRIDDGIIDYKCRLADAGNTYNHAFSIIVEKGYKLFLYPSHGETGFDIWATKDGRDFIATNPLALLGLIEIWERFGDNWRDQDVSDYYDVLMEKTFATNCYKNYDDIRYNTLKADLKLFFERIGYKLSDDVTKEELVYIMDNFANKIEEDAENS
jgi:hypothetical protein